MTVVSQKKACDLILFGTLGDLARRKLLPALYQLEQSSLLHSDTRIIAVAREPHTQSAYESVVEENLRKFLGSLFNEQTWQLIRKRLHYLCLDIEKEEQYYVLKDYIAADSRIPICYCAIPPALFGCVTDNLAKAGLISPTMRIVLEKPIGNNLRSAQDINNAVSRYFTENQVYRIDHYLGKETVLNLLALRFANAIFASNWDHNAIDHVQITIAEEVGVEGRWAYYDDAGQMRDMLQNHLLQVLSLIAMEPPISLEADSIRDEKLKVLKALRPINQLNVQECTVRGQYTAGFVNGQQVPGYLEEDGAHKDSTTETFVAMKVNIDNWRWAGVPFYLRTGKRMSKKASEVAIYFKAPQHNIFNKTYKQLTPNKLIIRLQPDEGVEIQIMNKIPGLGESMQLQESKLDLSFDETFKKQRIADAYERLLLEVMLGNQYLFVRRDEVEEAWRWIEHILQAWEDNSQAPRPYQAGTWGPALATSLLARDGHSWDE